VITFKCEVVYIPVVRPGNCQAVIGQAGVQREKMRRKRPEKVEKGHFQHLRALYRETGLLLPLSCLPRRNAFRLVNYPLRHALALAAAGLTRARLLYPQQICPRQLLAIANSQQGKPGETRTLVRLVTT
jgi:hypothetical protein